MRPRGGPPGGAGDAPPALAFWLPADACASLAAAAQTRLDEGHAPAALVDARRELDAAVVRARWLDHPTAPRYRAVAGLGADAVAARLTTAERDALIDCDPALARPLLDATDRPSRPAAVPDPAAGTAPTIELPARPAAPVVLLTEGDGQRLRWAVGEIDGDGVRTWQPEPADPVWRRACDETQVQLVDIEAVAGARRLVARAHPALSTLALARADLRPGAGESVLLRLPDIVVVASQLLARRVAAFASPVPVRVVPPETLPAAPTHPAHSSK